MRDARRSGKPVQLDVEAPHATPVDDLRSRLDPPLSGSLVARTIWALARVPAFFASAVAWLLVTGAARLATATSNVSARIVRRLMRGDGSHEWTSLDGLSDRVSAEEGQPPPGWSRRAE